MVNPLWLQLKTELSMCVITYELFTSVSVNNYNIWSIITLGSVLKRKLNSEHHPLKRCWLIYSPLHRCKLIFKSSHSTHDELYLDWHKWWSAVCRNDTRVNWINLHVRNTFTVHICGVKMLWAGDMINETNFLTFLTSY